MFGFLGSVGVLGVLGMFGLFFFIIALAFYVLKSVGLMTLAGNIGIENAWLAWIPIADLYIAGCIVGEMDLFGSRLNNLSMWLPCANVAGMVLGSIPIVGILVVIALVVFNIMFFYNLFAIYTESAVIFIILSVILGLLPVFLFIIRNNQPLNQILTRPRY